MLQQCPQPCSFRSSRNLRARLMSFPCPLPSINGSIATKKLLHITKLLAKALEILEFRNHSKKVVMQERTLLKILYSYQILEVCREKGLNSSVEVTADCAGILQNIQWLSTIQFHVYGHLLVALQPKLHIPSCKVVFWGRPSICTVRSFRASHFSVVLVAIGC